MTSRGLVSSDRSFGVIGAGQRGTELVHQARACPNVEMAAFADVYNKRLEDACRLAPGAAPLRFPIPAEALIGMRAGLAIADITDASGQASLEAFYQGPAGGYRTRAEEDALTAKHRTDAADMQRARERKEDAWREVETRLRDSEYVARQRSRSFVDELARGVRVVRAHALAERDPRADHRPRT